MGNYRKMTALRQQYPNLKVTLAIGGWNEGSIGYSALASSPERRQTFILSTIQFLKYVRYYIYTNDNEISLVREEIDSTEENIPQKLL